MAYLWFIPDLAIRSLCSHCLSELYLSHPNVSHIQYYPFPICSQATSVWPQYNHNLTSCSFQGASWSHIHTLFNFQSQASPTFNNSEQNLRTNLHIIGPVYGVWLFTPHYDNTTLLNCTPTWGQSMDSTTQLATLYKLSTATSYVQACRGITPTTPFER